METNQKHLTSLLSKKIASISLTQNSDFHWNVPRTLSAMYLEITCAPRSPFVRPMSKEEEQMGEMSRLPLTQL